jgi:hypothetical protein
VHLFTAKEAGSVKLLILKLLALALYVHTIFPQGNTSYYMLKFTYIDIRCQFSLQLTYSLKYRIILYHYVFLLNDGMKSHHTRRDWFIRVGGISRLAGGWHTTAATVT